MIEVAGLRKAYAGRTVLDGIDVTVRPGELLALLGRRLDEAQQAGVGPHTRALLDAVVSTDGKD